MISIVLGFYQKMREQPTDLWLLVLAFIVTLILFLCSLTANKRRLALDSQQGTTRSPSPSHGQNNLIIHYAGYGIGGSQYIDVTEKLTALIVNEGLYQRITSSLFKLERPYYNQEKHLLVVYSAGKEKREKRVVHVEEEGLLELP